MPQTDVAPNTVEQETVNVLLVGMDEVAVMLGVCRRTVIRLNLSGRLPKAIRVGRCVRWNRRELISWADHGCPPRGRWQPMWEMMCR